MDECDIPDAESIPHSLTVLLQLQAAGWQRGERPGVEYLLTGRGDEPTVLLALVVREWELRQERGETPRLDEYLHRFPNHSELLRQQFEIHATLRAAQSYATLRPGVHPEPAPSAGGDGAEPLLEQVVREWEQCEAQGQTPCLDDYARRYPQLADLLHRQYEVHEFARGSQARIPAVEGYEILGELGRGGMGVVYKARHLRLNRLVALKMLLNADADPEAVTRFLGEAEAVARLGHPNVVGIHDVGELPDGRLYCAFEHIAGGSLAQKLAGAVLQPRDAAALVQAVARGVHAAHERDVIHRDLKPANVLLAEDGTPKVADFGLAKRLDADAGQTRSGDVFGTPSYMAPEQAAGRVQLMGPRTDVWALGAILYECLTGRPPFRGATPHDTVIQVCLQEPVSPRTLVPKTPRDLETICLKCLHKKPERRYGSAAELADDLGRYLSGNEPIRARPPSAVERLVKWVRRHPTAAALLAAVVLAAVALAAVELWHRAEQDRTRAGALVEALLSADTAEVPARVDALAGLDRYARPLLQAQFAAADATDRDRLHSAIALLPDETMADYLSGRLTSATPAEALVLRRALKPYRDRLTPRLWAAVKAAQTPGSQRLPQAVVLAEFDPDSPSWSKAAPALAEQLVRENAIPLGQWLEGLRPVRASLVPPLLALAHDRTKPTVRAAAVGVLTACAHDRPEVLVDLLLDADVNQYAGLFPKVEEHRGAAVPLLRERLQRDAAPEWPDARRVPPGPNPGAAVRRQLAEADGMLAEQFAFCQTLPLDDLKALADGLRHGGYRLVKVRPYLDGKAVRTAALWARDGAAVRWEAKLTVEEVRRRDVDNRRDHFRAVDVAGYLTPEGARYAAVWQGGQTGETALLSAGLTKGDLEAAAPQRWRELKLAPVTLQGFRDSDGALRCSVVWGVGTPVCDWIFDADEATLTRANPDKTLLDVAPWPRPESPVAYAALWHADEDRESRLLRGPDPPTLRDRGRALAALGWRPLTVSVCPTGPGEPTEAVALWERPVVTDEAHDLEARRRALAASTLLRLGEPDTVWPLFRHRDDPTTRSWLIHCPGRFGVKPEVLLDRYRHEQEPSARRALLLALGEYDPPPVGRGSTLEEELRRAFSDDPDPGLHGAIDWLLRRWGQARALDDAVAKLKDEAARTMDRDRMPPAGFGWFVNREGQTFTVVRNPDVFLMGAPYPEPGRRSGEVLHRRHIDRDFAVATRPVTVAEFQRFLRANPEIQHAHRPEFAPDPDCPITHVTWFQAAAYCRWLSELEGVTPDEMCYPEIPRIKEGMKPLKDYLKRTGYRLPTEAEWEYACRAGTVTAQHYGRGDGLMGEYAWYRDNSRKRTWPVGSKKPNDLGLFDLHGNVRQWTNDPGIHYDPNYRGGPTTDGERYEPVDGNWRRFLRGGAFGIEPDEARSGFRLAAPPDTASVLVGFRVARTIPRPEP